MLSFRVWYASDEYQKKQTSHILRTHSAVWPQPGMQLVVDSVYSHSSHGNVLTALKHEQACTKPNTTATQILLTSADMSMDAADLWFPTSSHRCLCITSQIHWFTVVYFNRVMSLTCSGGEECTGLTAPQDGYELMTVNYLFLRSPASARGVTYGHVDSEWCARSNGRGKASDRRAVLSVRDKKKLQAAHKWALQPYTFHTSFLENENLHQCVYMHITLTFVFL